MPSHVTISSTSMDQARRARLERVAEGIAEGRQRRQIAKDLGVDPGTISAWTRENAWILDRAREIQAETREAAKRRIVASVESSVDELRGMLGNEAVPWMVRKQAACELLDRAGIRGAGGDSLERTEADLDALDGAELADALAAAVAHLQHKGEQKAG